MIDGCGDEITMATMYALAAMCILTPVYLAAASLCGWWPFR